MFKFCPECGSAKISFKINKYSCESCGLVYYQNTAAAAAVIVRYKDSILFTVRGKDPGKGMLDLPGGFIDPDETAEEAAIREIWEELGIELKEVRYLFSKPNTYPYKNFIYKTCDLIFEAEISFLPENIQKEEIAGIKLIQLDKINMDEIAFSSIRNALAKYQEMNAITKK